MRYVYLSYSLYEGSPVYKGLKGPHIIHENIISEAGYNTYIVCAENHAGTHVDAPRHFLEKGKSIADYGLDELIFDRVMLWDCPPGPDGQISLDAFTEMKSIHNITDTDLQKVECLLIRTGFHKYRDNDLEKYLTDNPGISPELIDHIRRNFPKIRVLGIDSISISSYNQPETAIKAHQTAFIDDEEYGEPLLLIEDMKLQDLTSEKAIDVKSIEKLFIIPWQIKGIDSAPCSIVAHLKD